jgi:phosphate transport system substrate-binding protein
MKTTFLAGLHDAKGLRILRNLGLFLIAITLAGCPAGKQEATPPPANPTKVVIRGSNTIGEELAPRLIAEFKKDHPTIDFDLVPKATGYGLAALRAGQCDIAAASRTATKDEMDEAHNLGVVLEDHLIGAYSVAVVVHAGNAVTNLTREQVRDIFTGAIQNWKDVGGADAAIHLYVRDPISGTYLGFKELAMDNKPYADSRKLAKSYAEIVSDVAQDENGIGYAGVELPKDSGVKNVAIGGITPTAASVNEGKYPYARALHLYTRKDRETAATKDFVDYVQSKSGQDILVQMGFVSHP